MKAMKFLIIFLLAGSQPALSAIQSCTRGAAVITADSPHRCCCSGMPCCCCNKGMHKKQGASSHAKNPYGTCTNPFCSAASGMPGQEITGVVEGSLISSLLPVPAVVTFMLWADVPDMQTRLFNVFASPPTALFQAYPPLRI